MGELDIPLRWKIAGGVGFVAFLVLIFILPFITSRIFNDGFMSKNTTYLGCQSCGGYDMLNMDEYSVIGPHSAAMTAPPCTLHDQIHESYAYDCYSKPDDFLRRLDRVYQPFHQDGVGVLRNIYAARSEGARGGKSEGESTPENKSNPTDKSDSATRPLPGRKPKFTGKSSNKPSGKSSVDSLNPPNEYPPNPPMCNGYYSPLYNTVVTARPYGCFGASTQPTGSIPEGRLPLFYSHDIDSVSEISRDARNQRWYGPHSGYLN